MEDIIGLVGRKDDALDGDDAERADAPPLLLLRIAAKVLALPAFAWMGFAIGAGAGLIILAGVSLPGKTALFVFGGACRAVACRKFTGETSAMAEEWDALVAPRALRPITITLPALSQGWADGLLWLWLSLGVGALCQFSAFLDKGETIPFFLTATCACLPLGFAADVAGASSDCDEIGTSLNKKRPRSAQDVASDAKLQILERAIEKENKGAGIGFVVGGGVKVLDRTTLRTVFAAMAGFLSTAVPLILALQQQETVIGTAACSLTTPQVTLIKTMASLNGTCSYDNVTIGSVLRLKSEDAAGQPRRTQCAHAPPYPACTAEYPKQHEYSVAVVERDPYRGRPLISKAHGDSDYAYNFNGPWFPPPAGSGATDGLIVRVQEDWRLPNATHPEWTDTGALTVVRADVKKGTAQHINASLVFWPGTAAPPRLGHVCTQPRPLCGWGAIDPRIRYRPKTRTYYLTWDNCTFQCTFRSSMLSVSKDPFNASSWTLVGPIIPKMQTAGVALLFRDDVPGAKHLAFVSTYNCFTISLAESTDGKTWAITDPSWMQGRPGCWDACGAIAGPQPEVLSTGDYFMVYNIDTEAAGKGNDTRPLGRCTIGWAILNGSNPRQVVARSPTAIVSPTEPWETTKCGGRPRVLKNGTVTQDTCQTPNVIFATGLKPLGDDAFLVVYGGGDYDMAAIKIQVNVKK